MKPNEIPLLTCRQIQASVAGPLIEAFAQTLGHEHALQIASFVISRQAEEAGRQAAASIGGISLKHLWQIVCNTWAGKGALGLKLLEMDAKRLYFNVDHCAYVDMYRRMSLSHLGTVLSCSRDAAFVRGFNPEIQMERSQTIMTGGHVCDFRFNIR